MRPPIDDAAIMALRSELPEFEDRYLDLLDIYDEDLTPDIVLMELADFVANLVATRDMEAVLERCLAAVENLAAGTEEGPEIVAYAFFNEIPLGSREVVRSYLGPVSTPLAELIYRGESPEDITSRDGDEQARAEPAAKAAPSGSLTP